MTRAFHFAVHSVSLSGLCVLGACNGGPPESLNLSELVANVIPQTAAMALRARAPSLLL